MAANILLWRFAAIVSWAALWHVSFCDAQAQAMPPQDATCNSQIVPVFNALAVNDSNFHSFFSFANDSTASMSFTWASQNGDVIILLSGGPYSDWNGNELIQMATAKTTVVYRSTNFGRTYVNITGFISNGRIYVRSMSRNPRDPQHIILYGRDAANVARTWFTFDGGVTWNGWQPTSNWPSLSIEGAFIFGSHDNVPVHYLLAPDYHGKRMYVSVDGGATFRLIGTDVNVANWGRTIDSNTVYRLVDNVAFPNGTVPPCCTLQRSTNTDYTSWSTIDTSVYNFMVLGHFVYYSVLLTAQYKEERALHVYTQIKGSDFALRVNLPTATPDRFFSVLDIESEQAFVHVDEPGRTGRGTLYVSDATGAVFSESLRNHFHADGEGNVQSRVNDFTKVQSMRGVYVTSVLLSDNSLATRISFTRGSEWLPLRQPSNTNCSTRATSRSPSNNKDDPGAQPCALHLALTYAMLQNAHRTELVAYENAKGLVLAHGHTDLVAQDANPDVYLSVDGGYEWRLVLKGPHYYSMSNSGSVIAAVPYDRPSVIRFSVDYGRCWHEYSFGNFLSDFNVTGLVTEPSGRALSVAAWGYSTATHKWGVHVFDFAAILTRTCSADDYESWTPHAQLYSDIQSSDTQGCLLGLRETFLRPKRDSWCANEFSHNQTSKSEVCKCTMADYDCEYGHYRPSTKSECVLLPGITEAEICISGELQRADNAYRKIPGDQCQSGFVPATSASFSDLRKRCDKSPVTLPSIEVLADPNAPQAASPLPDVAKQVNEAVQSRNRNVWLAIFFIVLGVLTLALMAFLYRVMMKRRYARHRGAYKYRPLSIRDDGRNDQQTERLLDDEDDPVYDRSPTHNVTLQVPAQNALRTNARRTSESNSSNNDDLMLSLDANSANTNNLNSAFHGLLADPSLNIVDSSDQSALLRELDV